MKILFTLTYFSPYVSGLTIHIERLVKTLTAGNNKIIVLTSQNQKNLPLQEKHQNLEIIRVPYLLKFSKGFISPKYPFSAFKAVKKSEIIVINLPQPESVVVALLAKILRKKLFAIYHCEVSLPKSIPNFVIENLLHLSSIISLFLSDKIITYTKDFAESSKCLRPFIKKTNYVYPPIVNSSLNKKIQEKIKKSLPNKKYIIGIAARLAAEKGIEYVLEAIPLLKEKIGDNFIIIIAGPKKPVGEEKYWEKINPILNKYKNNVFFTGTIPSIFLKSFYSLLDVLVLPSINSTEAFGMVQVEAMLCGIPVVTTNLPGVRVPIIKTKMGEIAKIADPTDLSKKIIKVLENKKKYAKNKDQVKKIFSIKETILSYEKLFKSIS